MWLLMPRGVEGHSCVAADAVWPLALCGAEERSHVAAGALRHGGAQPCGCRRREALKGAALRLPAQ